MINETKKNIEAYKALLPGLKERVAAVALMLVMSVVMMTSATYAWLTISRAPEVQGMNTTITGNGNLEIALAPADGSVPQNSQGVSSDLLDTNITWGNLVNLSDSRYGLDEIFLRPALLSGYNRNQTPLYGASYGEDGRVDSTSDKYGYASYVPAEDGTYYFAAGSAAKNYGVRAISSVTYKNVTGNAAANLLIKRATDAYSEARGVYLNLIENNYLISSPGVYPEVYSMDALSKVLKVFVQEKADYYVKRLNGTAAEDIPPADYSGVVVYTYKLALAFQDVLEKEGEGLVYLANLQAYKGGAESTETFKDVAALIAANSTTLTNYGIKLESLTTFKTDYTNIQKTIDGLAKVISDYDLDEFSTGKGVTWSKVNTYINYLVDINSTTIAQTRTSEKFAIGGINSDNLTSLLSILQNCQDSSKPADVVIYKGVLSNLEKRLPEAFSYTLEGNNTIVSIPLTVKVNMVIININMNETPIYAAVRTEAAEPFLSNNDFAYSESLESSGNSGDAVANDTYGMALDMWVRTNVSNVILTLEGSLVTEEVTATTVDKNGNTTTLYTLTATTTSSPVKVYGVTNGEGVTTYYDESRNQIGDSTTMTATAGYQFTATEGSLDLGNGTVASAYSMTQTTSENQDAYKITVDGEDYWYKAETHVEIGKASAMTNMTATEQKVEVVVGYDGVNRVWEDYLSLIEAGLMAEHNTTQGAGSCYVFYADPSDQTRILHLLEAFSVVFMDQDGVTLGTAKLDTEHYYSINGKTTVPLKMVSGAEYEDKDGNQQIGITALEKNEATWITSIIYLDGQRLSNADVLAVGEIEGSLNIQFGSSVSLVNQDDTDLRNEQREIEAVASANGATSSSTQQPIIYEYDGNSKTVTVTLTVTGKQPKTIKGFFLRSISATQGTRGETVDFTPNGNNTWTATFDLSRPGTYSLRNLIVDGSDYSLYDGTANTDDFDNFPTVVISGMGINSVGVSGINTGITMTADSYVAATVTVSINTTEALKPKQVRALFRSANGREFTAVLSNTSNGGMQGSLWSGVANITESGTYTLQYLVMDGQHTELDPSMQSTHIIYLGLTAQVWSDGVPVEDENGNTVNSTTFEFKGETNLDMQVKLFDGSGNELQALEDVWLYYWNDGSILDQDGMNGQVKWNALSGYYEGTLELKSGGTFVFNRVVANKGSGNESKILKASVAPTFLAYVTDPPVYEGHSTTAYQFVPNGGATMQVALTNAQTATMWALIKDVTSGTVYMVPCASREKDGLDDENLYVFAFNIPAVQKDGKTAQDGDWQMIGLYMQGCANDNEEWVGLTEDPLGGANWITLTDNGDGTWTYGTDKTLDPADYVTFDLSGNGVTAYVVQTIFINGKPSNEITFDKVVFGKDDTGKVTGAFMQSYTSAVVSWKVTDWNQNNLADQIAWTPTYGNNSETYGGYSMSGSVNGLPSEQLLINNNNTFELQAQTLHIAGSYTSTFTIVIGTETKTIQGPSFEVWSVAPVLTISSISPAGEHTCINSSGSQVTVTSSINGNTITIYPKGTVTGSGCNKKYNLLEEPKVTLKLTGLGYAQNATLTFTAQDGGEVRLYSGTNSKSGTQTDAYTWNQTTGETVMRFVGYNDGGSCDDSEVAGTLTSATEIVFTYYNESTQTTETYTVKVNAITIVNNEP